LGSGIEGVGVVLVEGEGASFTISLQKGYQHFKATDSILHEPAVIKLSETQIRKKSVNETLLKPTSDTLLIVEDNDQFGSYLADILSETYNE